MPREPRPYKHNGWWRTSANGKKHHKLLPADRPLTEAKKALYAYLSSPPASEEEEAVPKEEKPTVRTAVTSFLQRAVTEVRASTCVAYRTKANLLLAFAADTPLDEIDLDLGFAYKAFLVKERGLAPGYVKVCLELARTVWRWAASPSRGLMPNNNPDPWVELTLPTGKPRSRLMTDEEFAVILSLAIPTTARALRFLRATGCRPCELVALTWDMVRPGESRVLISDPALVKTGRPRSITLTPAALRVLEDIPVPSPTSSGHVFLNSRGQPLTKNTLTWAFHFIRQKAVKLGKLVMEKSGERLVLYSSRHTRITELLRAGVPLSVVSREAGHSTPATTARVYSHLTDQDVTASILKHEEKEAESRRVKGGAF